jgi:hypothetical protein
MSTIIEADERNAFREVIEAWAADRQPPTMRVDGRFVSLRDWLIEDAPTPDWYGSVPMQLPRAYVELVEGIVGDVVPDFQGTEYDAAVLLHIELVSRSDTHDAALLRKARADSLDYLND